EPGGFLKVSRWSPRRTRFYHEAPKMAEIVRRVDAERLSLTALAKVGLTPVTHVSAEAEANSAALRLMRLTANRKARPVMCLSLHSPYRAQVAASDIPSVTLRLMEDARRRSADFVAYCDFRATQRRPFRARVQRAAACPCCPRGGRRTSSG